MSGSLKHLSLCSLVVGALLLTFFYSVTPGKHHIAIHQSALSRKIWFDEGELIRSGGRARAVIWPWMVSVSKWWAWASDKPCFASAETSRELEVYGRLLHFLFVSFIAADSGTANNFFPEVMKSSISKWNLPGQNKFNLPYQNEAFHIKMKPSISKQSLPNQTEAFMCTQGLDPCEGKPKAKLGSRGPSVQTAALHHHSIIRSHRPQSLTGVAHAEAWPLG